MAFIYAIMPPMPESSYFRRAAMWRPASRISRAAIPEHYRSWLLDTSSLTQRVMAACRGRFRVQVLSQAWHRPLVDERHRLDLHNDTRALVRQVRLLCDDQPWVYARTVIPRSTLRGGERRLAHLGARPLGAALFADPTMEREPMEIVQLITGQTLFDVATLGLAAPAKEIWGRRSVFRLSGKPLLVSEIFLAGIPASPCR
jgi:chorismate--pyruvate lyase